MFEKIFSIALNTFTESIRQPIYLVMTLVTVFLLVLSPMLSAYTFDDDNKIMIDMSLSMMLLGGLLLSAFIATGVLSREIENKTVLTVISKPISRPTFVVGKYLGVVGALAMAYWIWSLVFLLTVRHRVMESAAQDLDGPVLLFGGLALVLALGISLWGNYFYNWVFTSRFVALLALALPAAYFGILLVNNRWGFQSITVEFVKHEGQLPQILLAMLMVLEALAMICAIAVACSTRLGQVMTLVICVAVALLGLSSDFIFGRYVEYQPVAWIGYAAAPNIQYMWLADALTQKHPVSGTYVGLVSGYALLYTAAVLCLATALFQTRETG